MLERAGVGEHRRTKECKLRGLDEAKNTKKKQRKLADKKILYLRGK